MQLLTPIPLAGLIVGGILISCIPVIIHLLNRRRFIVVDWAPMKYLKLTIRTNRRRMQIEQLILLILRTLLMLLLVLTIARIALSTSSLGSWLSKRARVSRVIVLDDSLAMGYKTDGKTAFDRAKQAATEMLRNSGSKDAVTFLTTTPASAPLVKEASLDDPTRVISQVELLQTTDAAANWAGTFKTVDDCLNSATFPQKQVVIITDLRRAGWSRDVTEIANRWAAKGVEARVVDIGSHGTANIALLNFSQEDRVALPGVPLKLTASISNTTTGNLNGAQATLAIDGQTRPVVLPEISSGKTASVPLTAILPVPGQHMLRLGLPDDALPGDNVRYLSITVREKLDAILVDGRRGGEAYQSASDNLHNALISASSSWNVRVISDTDLEANHPTRADVTCLVDIANLTSTAVTEYEKLVKDGMGLVIFGGEETDPTLFNERLYKNGKGLLPARIERVVDGPVKGLIVEKFDESPLTALAHLVPAALSRVSVRKFYEMQTTGKLADGVQVLARWNDPEAHIAAIEKQFGKGRVILWTTSADAQWAGEWPKNDPSYVLAMDSTAHSVARPDTTDDNIKAGYEMIIPQTEESKINPRLTVPNDPTPIPIPRLRYDRTEHAGFYTLTWNDPAGKEQHHQLAVSCDRTASDLEPLGEDQLASLLGNLKAQVVPYHTGELASAGAGREIWRTLAGTLLALMVVETLFAFYVGREK